jgi:hypothetical protein
MVTLTSEEPSLSREVKVANLCEAGTGIIHPDSRWQTCVKQGQELFIPIKVGPCQKCTEESIMWPEIQTLMAKQW